MVRIKFGIKKVPRVELDQRARDARVRLVQIERLIVPRASVAGFWLSPLGRLLGSRAGGNRRGGGRVAARKAIRALAVFPNRGASGQKTAQTVWPDARAVVLTPSRGA